jgi:hypothetical protein
MTQRRPHSLAFALVVVAALAACVQPRNINEPIPGAMEYSLPDSAGEVLRAVEASIIDEALDIGLVDREKGLVESRYTDIGSVRATTSREGYSDDERNVRFRFFARPMLGGTTLYGEVVYRPVLGGMSTGNAAGRGQERMVRADHAGREVLARIVARAEERLRVAREQRGSAGA